jgi:hypothetical protein
VGGRSSRSRHEARRLKALCCEATIGTCGINLSTLLANKHIRLAVTRLWRGTTLASLFFYPLTAAMSTGSFWLQWRRQDAGEFLVAFAVAAVVLGTAWDLTLRPQQASRRAVLQCLVVLGPLLSFFSVAVRLFPRDWVLWRVETVAGAANYGEPGALAQLLIGGLLLAFLWTVAAKPIRFLRVMDFGLLVASPIVFVVFFSVLSALMASPERGRNADSSSSAGLQKGDKLGQKHVVVMVFDELSYRYLYQGRAIRSDLPHLAGFSSGATNYHAASSAGEDTLASMFGLLAGRRLRGVYVNGNNAFEGLEDGEVVPVDVRGAEALFPLARAAGYRTEMIGYAIPYCAELGGTVDDCHAFSLFNYSTSAPGWSIVHPVMSNFLLWPHQSIFGFVRIPVAVFQQKRRLEEMKKLATAELSHVQPVFRLVHFSVPHIPFVSDDRSEGPGPEPFIQDEKNYVMQLRFLDGVVGDILSGLSSGGVTEESTVVLTSDHEYRALVPVGERARVPLIITRSRHQVREDVDTPVFTPAVVRALLTSR